MLKPADEDHDVQPDPRLDPFFIMIMFLRGDPSGHRWIETNAAKFYEEYRAWVKDERRKLSRALRYRTLPSGPAVMLQYIVWYDRELSRVDARYK